MSDTENTPAEPVEIDTEAQPTVEEGTEESEEVTETDDDSE